MSRVTVLENWEGSYPSIARFDSLTRVQRSGGNVGFDSPSGDVTNGPPSSKRKDASPIFMGSLITGSDSAAHEGSNPSGPGFYGRLVLVGTRRVCTAKSGVRLPYCPPRKVSSMVEQAIDKCSMGRSIRPTLPIYVGKVWVQVP